MNDIYRYLFSLSKDHHLSEDLLQETFYRAYTNIQELTPENIKPWLFTVAHNLFIDYYRKNKRIILVEDKQLNRIQSITNIEEDILTQENIQSIVNLIDSLPSKQKYAITLCDLNDLSYDECTKIMDVTLASFKSTLFRARRKLRKWNSIEVKNDG